MKMPLFSRVCLIIALPCALAGSVRAEPCYYLLMFGAQYEKARPKYSHTFATFVKVDPTGPDGGSLEVQTISWLPATLDVRVLACRPECGKNVELHQTIRWALSHCERISMWGPYRISADLYCRAARQRALLESGQVLYKAVDSFHDSSHVSNCIHAVSSIDHGYRLRVVSPLWGETASWYVLSRMEPWILDVCTVHPEIATRLGLDPYPLIRRPYENPRSGRLLGRLRSSSPQ